LCPFCRTDLNCTTAELKIHSLTCESWRYSCQYREYGCTSTELHLKTELKDHDKEFEEAHAKNLLSVIVPIAKETKLYVDRVKKVEEEFFNGAHMEKFKQIAREIEYMICNINPNANPRVTAQHNLMVNSATTAKNVATMRELVWNDIPFYFK
jgi:hypothetical protein